ncbi:hypothetical protein HanPSC8_Chr04g0150641 [Helianthus annuus]|nr:hypothetical protein HanPSC8_Chr04g0150641 [Helianthus annuus]
MLKTKQVTRICGTAPRDSPHLSPPRPAMAFDPQKINPGSWIGGFCVFSPTNFIYYNSNH